MIDAEWDSLVRQFNESCRRVVSIEEFAYDRTRSECMPRHRFQPMSKSGGRATSRCSHTDHGHICWMIESHPNHFI